MKAIVITARGLRAQALGCYGNPWIDTPALDTLAAQGVVFDRHFAGGADPAAAHRAWRSGRYQLPAAPGASAAALPPGPDLLAALRSQGVFTCLLVDATHPSPPDFAEGWDAVERIGTEEGGELSLEAILERALDRLEALRAQPSWLLWLDLGTALPPWDVPEEFQEPYFQEEAEETDEEADEDEEGAEEEEEPLLPLADPVPGPVDAADDTLYLRLWSS